jgi:hypothetical protein
MQRIVNNPDNIVDEMLKGIVTTTANPRVIKRVNMPADAERSILGNRRYRHGKVCTRS